jgi:ADP-heptose:LPS heptosyltransferase
MTARILPAAAIIVFRPRQLGDMLCAVPALRALRAAAPGARITLVGLPWAQRFVERFAAHVDDFLPFPGHPALPEQAVRYEELPAFHMALARRHPALAIQMHDDGTRTNAIVAGFGSAACAGFHPTGTRLPAGWAGIEWPRTESEPERLLRLVESLGAPRQGADLEFPVTAADMAELRASGLADGLEPGTYFCIHPGGRSRDQCWSIARLASVADHVACSWGLIPVFTGAADEAGLAHEVAVRMRVPARIAAGPISLGAMAALMAGARLLVSNDIAVSHIAAGLRLPSVVISCKADILRQAPAGTGLHRCLWDPDGSRTGEAMAHADALLAGTAPPGRCS